MQHEKIIIKIAGEEINTLYDDLISLEVELDDESPNSFQLQIRLAQQSDRTWAYLDDEHFQVWQQVTISAGFDEGVDELFNGYITHVKPAFDPDPSQCLLEVQGMDRSVLMDRAHTLKDWPGKKDSDIAREILQLHKLAAEVKDTTIVHNEAVSTIMQYETDWQFLQRLAERNGYECYVQGTTGYFRSPPVDAAPQPVLAPYSGDDTNLIRFAVEVNALTPTNVSMFQIDRANKAVLEATAQAGQQTVLGATAAPALLPADIDPAQLFVSCAVTTGAPEMTALVQSLYNQGEWFVTGEGEIAGNQYAHVLMPHGTVTIKDIGATYSGIYYVTHVTHTFTPDGYTQFFKVKRNALMATGAENFSASDALF